MIGSDPEFFIKDPLGRPVPAHRFFPYKTHATVVGDGVIAYRDGYALELNIKPGRTGLEVVNRIMAGVRGAARLLPPGYYLEALPTVSINLAEDLKDAPEDVLHFGCEPSYCAYTGARKVPRINAWEHPKRYAGLHMHFSAPEREIRPGRRFSWLTDIRNHRLFIRMLDGFLTSKPRPGDAERRRYYGQAGEYRPQQYPGAMGIEYRTPSPWLWSLPKQAVAFCFDRGYDIFKDFQFYKNGWSENPGARSLINRGGA